MNATRQCRQQVNIGSGSGLVQSSIYGVIRPQWVNIMTGKKLSVHQLYLLDELTCDTLIWHCIQWGTLVQVFKHASEWIIIHWDNMMTNHILCGNIYYNISSEQWRWPFVSVCTCPQCVLYDAFSDCFILLAMRLNYWPKSDQFVLIMSPNLKNKKFKSGMTGKCRYIYLEIKTDHMDCGLWLKMYRS